MLALRPGVNKAGDIIVKLTYCLHDGMVPCCRHPVLRLVLVPASAHQLEPPRLLDSRQTCSLYELLAAIHTATFEHFTFSLNITTLSYITGVMAV